jgi:hypothetical protein
MSKTPTNATERALCAQLYGHEQLLARTELGSARAVQAFGGLQALYGVAEQVFGKDHNVTFAIGKARDEAAELVAPGTAGELAAALRQEVC